VKALALEHEPVRSSIAGRRIVRAVYVPDRLLNLVTRAD
jgi:hypothetical protein